MLARILVLCACTALAAGCSTLQPFDAGSGSAPADSVDACESWFARIDQVVDQAGVRDAGTYRLPGFAYLRVDRFTSSFAVEAGADTGRFGAWLARLRALDAEARGFEFDNLAPAAGQARALTSQADACGSRLAARDSVSPEARRRIVALAKVPDEYSSLARTFGLYPLTSLAFASGIRAWERDTEESFRQAATPASADASVARYVPDASAAVPEPAGQILSRSPPDALGIPRIAPRDGDALLAAFAPVFEVEGRAPYDRIGAVAWSADRTPMVDAARVEVYGRIAFTRYRARTLVQLVYTVWFPERPTGAAVDFLAGRLDGVVLRVTLDPMGLPLLVDSIHPCGCYHMFFPGPRTVPRPPPAGQVEWMFTPAPLPQPAPGQRLIVRVASGSHYLTRVYGGEVQGGVPYRLADENTLRSLPLTQGGRRSLYGPDGIVSGTGRLERLFFWPMGIPDAGAMRQWGRHATAFVGRRHFDAPDLIEERFDIPDLLPKDRAGE